MHGLSTVQVPEVQGSGHLDHWHKLFVWQARTERRDRYRTLLAEFGIDPCFVEEAPPRPLYAEHPGNWFYPDDALRIRLAAALARRLGTEPWVLQFSNDVFRCNGLKRFFATWRLSFLGTTTWLVDPLSRRAWHGRSYGALPLEGNVARRIHRQLESALELFEAAASPQSLGRLLARRHPPDVRSLLGPPRGRAALESAHRRLEGHDLEAARRPLHGGLAALEAGAGWEELWRVMNQTCFGVRVGSLDPLFQRFLLAIDDPEKMAHRLARELPEGPIPLAGFVAEDGIFHLVYYRPGQRAFVASAGGAEAPMAWEDLQRLAHEGRTSGPCGIVEYLLMAACNLLVVCDPGDGHTPFERRIDRLHRQAVGLPYPWVSLPWDYRPGEPGCYLDLFDPEFEAAARRLEQDFFA